MLYREITPVCSEIHRKHINTLCGQNIVLLSFEPLLYIQWPLGFEWLIYIKRKFRLYRAVNTLYRGCENMSVNAV